MNAPHNPAQAHAWRRRTAAVFAAVGALIFSSGMVMITAPAANATNDVGLCHATGSDSNPYTYQSVDASSTGLEGHLAHRNDPKQTWSNGTWWNGVWHPAGSLKPDLIGGLDGVVNKALCDQPGEGARSVTPNVNFVDPSCGNDNTPSWTGTETDKVTYAVTSGTVAASQPVVVGATANAGYEFPRTASTSFPHSFGPVQDCRGTVGVVDPTVTQPACTGPGTSSALDVALANGPAGVSYGYNAATRVVTATVTDSTKKFAAALDADWTRVDDTHATYQVALVPAGDCLVKVTAAEPTATGNTCTTPGHLVLPNAEGDGYTWTGETVDGPGDHVVTAVADTGYEMTGQTQWTVHVKAAGEGLTTCGVPATEVTPLAPTWVEATCDTNPSVDYTEVAGVAYDTTGDVAPGNAVTVTASTVGNHVFANGVTTSWSHTFAAKPAGADCDEPTVPTEEPLVVTPNYPSAKAATCSRDGLLTVPGQPDGVLMTQLGSVPGDVSFTFTPAAGYVFPEGTDTDVTVSVGAKLSGADCILGEESHQPKPTKSKPKPRDRGPVVLGTQAAVPTAVDAGLSGLPTTSVSMTGSPRLAQALVAGGLLLLVAGGSMGLGRRTRGAHES